MPTITYTLNTGGGGTLDTAIVDSDMHSGFPTDNYNTATEMQCEYSSAAVRRTFWIKLTDLSDIPPGSTIDAVTVRVYRVSGYSDGGGNISLHQSLRDALASEITWNNARTGTAWTTGGGQGSATDRAASAAATMAVDNTNGYKTASGAGLVSLVQGWLDGSISNFGLIFLPETVDDFFSQWSTSEDTNGQRPEIVIDWTPPVGGSAAAAAHYYRRRRAA